MSTLSSVVVQMEDAGLNCAAMFMYATVAPSAAVWTSSSSSSCLLPGTRQENEVFCLTLKLYRCINSNSGTVHSTPCTTEFHTTCAVRAH